MRNSPIEYRTTWNQTVYAPIALLALTIILPPPQAMSQTVMPRNTAALSTTYPDKPVNETAIAAGTERVMAVYHVLTASQLGNPQIGYAIAELDVGGNWTWNEEGVIDPAQFEVVGLTDPSVAYDSASGDFLVCAMTRDQFRIVVARFDGGTGIMGAWQQVGATGVGFDKPWITTGSTVLPGLSAPSTKSEFYITYENEGHVGYQRTKNGGQSWKTSCSGQGFALTNVNDCNTRVPMESWPVPKAFGTQPLYVAFLDTDGIRLLRGDDINSGAHAGEVQFTQILGTDGLPLVIPQLIVSPDLWTVVPGPTQGITNLPRGWGVDLAADPTNADRLYVVYHDRASVGSPDISIYMRVLTRVSGPNPIWFLGPRLLVADDADELVETDQIHPAVRVDTTGRIHVIYYDDQDFTQDDGASCVPQCPRYDVKYAVSNNQGTNWTYQELCDDPPNCTLTEPALDYSQPNSAFWLGDFIGIDISGNRVWTSFMGSSATRDPTPNADKSLIWSSQIVLP